MPRNLTRLFTSLTLAAVMTACSSVPILSLPKLAGLSPETMDFANIELAVRVQDDFDVKPESAVFAVTITNDEDGEVLNERLVLDDDPRPLTPVLTGKLKPGFQIIRYHIDEDKAASANAVRERVIALKNADPGGNRGSLSASAGICRNPDGNPLLTPLMTIFVRFDPEDDFFTLIKETRLPLDMSSDEDGMLCQEAL